MAREGERRGSRPPNRQKVGFDLSSIAKLWRRRRKRRRRRRRRRNSKSAESGGIKEGTPFAAVDWVVDARPGVGGLLKAKKKWQKENSINY